jgi:hypothetical protein
MQKNAIISIGFNTSRRGGCMNRLSEEREKALRFLAYGGNQDLQHLFLEIEYLRSKIEFYQAALNHKDMILNKIINRIKGEETVE